MADPIRTSFPPMGAEGIIHSVVNVSGERSPYTKLEPRPAPAGDDLLGPKGPPPRHIEINAEVLGPLCKPQTTLFYPNAADHEKVGSRTILMPSRTGVSDFWAKRLEGDVLE